MNSINKITKAIEKYNNKKLKAIFETVKANNITCMADTYCHNRFGHIVEVADDCIFFKDHNNEHKEFQYYFKDMDITQLYYREENNKLYFYMFEAEIDDYLEER